MPVGISAKDQEPGMGASLENLARYVERPRRALRRRPGCPNLAEGLAPTLGEGSFPAAAVKTFAPERLPASAVRIKTGSVTAPPCVARPRLRRGHARSSRVHKPNCAL